MDAILPMILIITMTFLIGSFLLLLPISRRLGKALQEWVKLRHESSPDRALLEEMVGELRALRTRQESLEHRIELVAERQEFLESLVDARQQREIGPGVL